MGCTASKRGSFVSMPGSKLAAPSALIFNNGDAAGASLNVMQAGYKIDARCPLTERQLYQIGKSWKAISRNLEITAINMFVRLFETNAEIQAMFHNFVKFDTLADLRTSAALESHAMKVITTLDEAITNLDDVDYVISVLHKVAQSHCRRFPFFNAEMFQKIEEPFLLAVKETLGDRFTVSMAQTYREAIRFILNTVSNGFREAANKNSVAKADIKSNPIYGTGPPGENMALEKSQGL